jgi:hypothetical protein
MLLKAVAAARADKTEGRENSTKGEGRVLGRTHYRLFFCANSGDGKFVAVARAPKLPANLTWSVAA